MSVTFNQQNFTSLFPGAVSAKNGTAIEYTVEDSTYRIYNPSITSNSSSATTFDLQLDHVRGGATDDHVQLTVTFNGSAVVQSVAYTWTPGNDGYQIPKGVIEAVDITAEVLGAVGALETAGISEAAAQEIVETFDTCCKIFNELSTHIVKWTDNGGRFYFLPVVCHTFNRLCVSVSA
ncbi:hypothetical protein [Arundinibacter roseus]|uniref:Uncharacterized protein n=1 Tax=Arundinibacter roseus TaxID=2070510 RepID=A0A4V2X9J3_9BACT|nr:hypothetical protein [Arundinibacter roseus]TDB64065.1 hypothetical protein EZE20_14070 [Arundinibacter roseus]